MRTAVTATPHASRNGAIVRAVTRDASVTARGAIESALAHTSEDHAPIAEPAEILAWLDHLRRSAPAKYAVVIASLAPLDRGSLRSTKGEDQTGQEDPDLESDLSDQIIESLSRDHDLTLATLSLTAPSGYGAVIAPLGTLARVASHRAADHGAILVQDRRPRDGVEHGYGIVISRDPASVVTRWVDAVGADTACQRATTVTGWRRWSSGDDTARATLAANLRRIIRYAVRVHPYGSDLAAVSVASGCLRDAWVEYTARYARSEPLRVADMSRAAVTRTCARPDCGKPIPSTARRDALTCSAACRQALYRARSGSRDMSPGSVTRGVRR